MHDINLLPIDDRKRELDEIRKRQEAKNIVKIEMSSPEKKEKETEKKSGGFWSVLKNKFSNFKKDKPEKEIKKLRNEKLRENEKKPEIPKHLDNISFHKPSKEFYFKKNKNYKQEINKHEQELEDIVSYKPTTNNQPIYVPKGTLAGKQLKTKKTTSSLPENLTDKNSLLHEAPARQIGESLPKDKIETSLNINLIPTGIKKTYQNKNNLKTYLVSVLATIIICVLILIIGGQLVGVQRSDLQRLEKSIKETQEQIVLLEDSQLPVNEFIKLLRNVKGIIKKHVGVSKIFKLLEKNTLKDVYYTDLNIDANNSTVVLSVAAKDYAIAAQQILIFSSLDQVAQMETKSMSLVEEKEQTTDEEKKLGISPQTKKFVTFNLMLKLKADMFLK